MKNFLTNKQEALKVISSLPDTVSFEEIMYKLYVLEQIHQGKEDLENGEVTFVDDLESESEDW